VPKWDAPETPIPMIPFDLRMPNSEFDVLLDRISGYFIRVLRKDEIHLDYDWKLVGRLDCWRVNRTVLHGI
jgi:hypothetical protein